MSTENTQQTTDELHQIVTFSAPPDLVEDLEQISEHQGRSEQIRIAIRKHLEDTEVSR